MKSLVKQIEKTPQIKIWLFGKSYKIDEPSSNTSHKHKGQETNIQCYCKERKYHIIIDS